MFVAWYRSNNYTISNGAALSPVVSLLARFRLHPLSLSGQGGKAAQPLNDYRNVEWWWSDWMPGCGAPEPPSRVQFHFYASTIQSYYPLLSSGTRRHLGHHHPSPQGGFRITVIVMPVNRE